MELTWSTFSIWKRELSAERDRAFEQRAIRCQLYGNIYRSKKIRT